MRDVTAICSKRYIRIQPADVTHSMLSTKVSTSTLSQNPFRKRHPC